MSWILRVEGLIGVMEGKELRPTIPPGSATSTHAFRAGSKKEWDAKISFPWRC